MVDGEREYLVEQIVGEEWKNIGRGRKLGYHVKWQGYAQPSWVVANDMNETEALDVWLQFSSLHRDKGGQLPGRFQIGNIGPRKSGRHRRPLTPGA